MIAGVLKQDMAVATGSKCWNLSSTTELLTQILLVTYLFRTTGQVLGVALSGAILQGVLLQKLRSRIEGPGSAQVGV